MQRLSMKTRVRSFVGRLGALWLLTCKALLVFMTSPFCLTMAHKIYDVQCIAYALHCCCFCYCCFAPVIWVHRPAPQAPVNGLGASLCLSPYAFFDSVNRTYKAQRVPCVHNREKVLTMVKATKTVTVKVTKAGTATDVAITDFTKVFSTMLKTWPVKFACSKVTNEQLAIAASTGMRTGTAKHAAVAMFLRPEGATQAECNVATGDTNYAAYRDALKTDMFIEVPVERRLNGQPDSWGAKGGHKCFKLALKPKPKAKAPRKAKAPKAPAPDTQAPAPEAPAPEGGNA